MYILDMGVGFTLCAKHIINVIMERASTLPLFFVCFVFCVAFALLQATGQLSSALYSSMTSCVAVCTT